MTLLKNLDPGLVYSNQNRQASHDLFNQALHSLASNLYRLCFFHVNIIKLKEFMLHIF